MERLCPLCRKIGLNRKISDYPLNEYEAIEMCENSECTWPLGLESFKFIPRDNEILKEIAEKHKNLPVIPISTELSLYTPPVTPVDNQETKIDIKGNIPITDSYASPSTIVKDIKIFTDYSRSIFDIDSPEKANKSQICENTGKKLGLSGSNFTGKNKSLPTVMSSETVNSIKIVKKLPVKKVILKKIKKPAIKNVNMSVVPLSKNVNCLNLSKNISDTNKLSSKFEESTEIDSALNNNNNNNNNTINLPVISENSLINVNSNPLDVNFIKQEEINLESIIEDLKSGNTSHQMNIDEEWLTSFLV